MKRNHRIKLFLGLFFLLTMIITSGWYFDTELRDLAAKTKNSETMATDQKLSAIKLTGKIIFQSNRDGDEEIYVMNPDGSRLIKLTDNNAFDGYPVWSPDGREIAFESNRDHNFQIYIMDYDGKNQVRVTDGPFNSRFPSWSPDGKKIAYESKRDKGQEIYVMNLESKEEKMLTDAWYRSGLPNWSPDGNKIAFTANKLLGWGVYVVDRDGSDIKPLDTKGGSCRPHWSPEGKKIAYVSSKADRKGDIWLMNADGSDKRRLTTDSHKYDYYPSWSPDGKWIVYANSSDKKRGNWELRIIDIISGDSIQITHHPAQDKFPDWH